MRDCAPEGPDSENGEWDGKNNAQAEAAVIDMPNRYRDEKGSECSDDA